MKAAILVLALVATVAGTPAHSQDLPAEARLVAFTIEPREPEFGEVFELRLTVRIAPGVVAFLPDTLVPADASVSAGPGDWSQTSGPADSVDIRATYPVMGFLNGRVDLPSLELWTRPAAAGEVGGARPWSDLAQAGPTLGDGLRRILIPVGATQIIPLVEMADATGRLFPRPPADVLGGQWSIWFLSAVGITAIVSAILAWFLISRWRLARATTGLAQARSPRHEALLELDRIRGLGWHSDGRIVEFYDASTGVLRRFSEQEEPGWGIALTSTELLARLEDRWGPSSVEDLGSVVWVAESVKFGRHRPETESAEGHWMTIRDWIQGKAED